MSKIVAHLCLQVATKWRANELTFVGEIAPKMRYCCFRGGVEANNAQSRNMKILSMGYALCDGSSY